MWQADRAEKAGQGRLECPKCVQAREAKDLGPLLLPVASKRELVVALVSAPDDPWWEARVLHAKLYPLKDRSGRSRDQPPGWAADDPTPAPARDSRREVEKPTGR
ncbi:hypothetical protein [Kitasatospora sp. NPDC056531]|uniref:hypothetical protein n=1 Tax=Kitasatospora sp. NPDC056531 TaxID=3345856 RepID=UPI003685EEAF